MDDSRLGGVLRRDASTTMIYTYVLDRGGLAVRSPLHRLEDSTW
ncbi:MAG: hypothetical protein OES32_07795 [Acidobacteriota bacterium]|nr:hypothetical protein [Acidobacteriota bacterium]